MGAPIDEAADVFTLINTFHTSRERQGAIVESLRRFTEDVARELPGFVAASMHVSLDGARVVNYVQWRSRADLDAMLALPSAKVHMAEVGALADKVEPVPYRVAYVGSAG
ncbi:antibiotic biosynthesis monooxygenase [Caulobacter sp. S45]|uniref:antibiotic biosynthesis monooxygenase n=1 Tax=Caulobacter sp. S45 TaxID=1641861 RepID=UPI0015750B2D|nr:antibiotic biosynthesis monooxygenase [Caulobacter sp. S45]